MAFATLAQNIIDRVDGWEETLVAEYPAYQAEERRIIDLLVLRPGNNELDGATFDAVTLTSAIATTGFTIKGIEAGNASLALSADEGDDTADRWTVTALAASSGLQITNASWTANQMVEITAGQIKVVATEGASASLVLDADEYDDLADRWAIQSTAATNNLDFVNDITTVAGLSSAGVPSFAGSAINLGSTAAGAATTWRGVLVKKTGIADNTATDVITVTVPNANHAAAIRVFLMSSNGSTDAFESTRCAEGLVVLARTTGANAVAAVAALALAQIATVAAGATHTLAYDLSAVSGAAGATNTFTIRVTIDDSGNLGSNQVVVFAEVLNSEASGVTVAAA